MCERHPLVVTTMGGRLLDAVGGSRATSFDQMEAEGCRSSAVRLFPDSSSSKSLKMYPLSSLDNPNVCLQFAKGTAVWKITPMCLAHADNSICLCVLVACGLISAPSLVKVAC